MPPPERTLGKRCEVCNGPLDDEYDLLGCDRCGRMYGPCCNTEQEGVCIECA